MVELKNPVLVVLVFVKFNENTEELEGATTSAEVVLLVIGFMFEDCAEARIAHRRNEKHSIGIIFENLCKMLHLRY